MARRFRRHLFTAALCLCTTAPLALTASAAEAQIAVFDPHNYSQNLLTAARSLQQINNQIQSLQNQATMLLNQAKNLAKVDFPELQAVNANIQQIDRLMTQAQGIDFNVTGLDEQFRRLFPNDTGQALGMSEEVAAARSRLAAAMSAYRQTMSVQAQVAENVKADSGLLNALVTRSQGADGALQVAQTTNQLLALSTQQQLQIENLMAAQYRATATEAARRAQAEIDGRLATKKFLGNGSAYTPR